MVQWFSHEKFARNHAVNFKQQKRLGKSEPEKIFG